MLQYPFTLLDVIHEIYGVSISSGNLKQCFLDAIGEFNVNYMGSKNQLSNFRGYRSGLTDYDGNIYPIVKIGNQIWTAENFKCKHFSSGIPISYSTSPPAGSAKTY